MALRSVLLLLSCCVTFAGVAQSGRSASASEVPDIVLRPTIPAYFVGCGQFPEGTDEKADCSAGKLMAYIARNLQYPDVAREDHIEGVSVLSFVVSDSGFVRDVRVLRDVGGGCGAEAQRVVQEMPRWQPAVFKGEVVATQFTLPITFGLRTGMFDYVLHLGDLPDGEIFRDELLEAVGTYTPRVTDPKGEEMLVAEVIYTFERGGERKQLITRGAELPSDKKFSKFISRRGGRLTIEANVVDGLDVRTVSRGFTVVR